MGSIKNTRIRIADVKHGLVFYTAHHKHGIEGPFYVLGKPCKATVSGRENFINVKVQGHKGRLWQQQRSLDDAGILPGRGFNTRRSFRKLSQAKAYIESGKGLHEDTSRGRLSGMLHIIDYV